MQLTMVASFDLGGRFTSSQAVLDCVRKSDRFADAHAAARLHDRLQPSYRYSHEPEVLASERPAELRLNNWTGSASQRTTLHPSGVVTFEVTMPLAAGGIAKCTQIEEDFYDANAVRYQPYLQAAYQRNGAVAADPADDEDDRGVDLITPVIELRQLLAGVVTPRPERIVYPATDMRTVVSAVVDDLDDAGERLVREFVGARRARAQLSEAPTVPKELEGRVHEIQRSKVTIRQWGCVLFASCDVDAALIVADQDEDWAGPVASDCVAMAQRMWFIARTWVGVLDGIGTVEIHGQDMDEDELRDLQQKVIDLSAAEFEIQDSMATVEAAGVMLRDTWHVQLVGIALDCFEVHIQRRLIDQRVSAVARNHATVAEVLDRVHQNEARDQAERLQYLFSVAVAAGIASLVLSVLELDDTGWRAVTGVGTVVICWLLLAAAIWWVGRRRIPVTKAPVRTPQR